MSQAKIEFVRSLQDEHKPLWPYDISQRIRIKFSWLCLNRIDNGLDADLYRGYMVRPHTARAHTPSDPAHYWCVVAGNQSMGWQYLVWIKEMLQALDSEDALTSDADKLEKMLAMRKVDQPNDHNTPPHVIADKNGFTLALGCAIPRKYRETLRAIVDESKKIDPLLRAELESYIPAEYVDFVIDESFEKKLDTALSEIGSTRKLA